MLGKQSPPLIPIPPPSEGLGEVPSPLSRERVGERLFPSEGSVEAPFFHSSPAISFLS